MRHLIFTLTLLLFENLTFAQNSEKKDIELGATLLTVNPTFGATFDLLPKTLVEYGNGIFFRYQTQRVGIRAFVSYTKYHTSLRENDYSSTFYDGYGGALTYRDLKIGLGAQITLFKKCRWLYSFADF